MIRALALAIGLIAPALAGAGGYVGLTGAYAGIVEVVCFPEDRFHLCPVPPVNGLPYHLPRTVPTHATLDAEGPAFSILVTPNVAPYGDAVAKAASVAAAYCGQQAGETVVARIDQRWRHAPERLESWKFAGRCQ